MRASTSILVLVSLLSPACVLGSMGNDAGDAADASQLDAPVDQDASPLDVSADNGAEAAASRDVVSDANPDVVMQDAEADGGPPCGEIRAPSEVMLFELRTAAFPNTSWPDVAVHIPPGFTTCKPMGAIVFFHGFNNCVRNIVGNMDTACVTGSGARGSLNLVGQIDAAHVNAILIAVQGPYDQASGDPGRLALFRGGYNLLDEVLGEHLLSVFGRRMHVEDLDRVVLSCHSGGYQVVASVLEYGEIPNVREVDLHDALYGNTATYDAFVSAQTARFDHTRSDSLRFVDVYTSGGGTDALSRSMAMRARSWMQGAGLASEFFWDDTTATLVPADYAHSVIFKFSGLSHRDEPRYYFERLASASGFATLP